MGHLIWAQQDCYTMSGLKPPLDEKYFEPYKTGTFPKEKLNEGEISQIKQQLIAPLDIMSDDLRDCPLAAKKAIQGLPFHDWLHIGYILAMKRIL